MSAPKAVKVAAVPLQTVLFAATVTVGEVFTVIKAVVEPVHPREVPVMVYPPTPPRLIPLTITLFPVVAFKPIAGNQVYVSAPLAVNVVEDPIQILTFADDSITREFTLTSAIMVVEQILSVPVIL